MEESRRKKENERKKEVKRERWICGHRTESDREGGSSSGFADRISARCLSPLDLNVQTVEVRFLAAFLPAASIDPSATIDRV